MHCGFLHYISHPTTEQANTALLAVLHQLCQESLPIFCDEGVYRVVAGIVLQILPEFKNLFPLLRGFHMAKATLLRSLLAAAGENTIYFMHSNGYK